MLFGLIMRTALHPLTRRPVTVDEYIADIGHRFINAEIPERLRAVCPVCNARMSVRGEGVRQAHFAHRPGQQCPTINGAAIPYEPLEPANPDPEAGRRLCRAFRMRWQNHYHRMLAELPFMSVQEFIGVLEIANERNIWEHVGFPAQRIPFALLVLADYPPWTGVHRQGVPRRDRWYRFFFTHPNAQIADLWIERANPTQLLRVDFPAPRDRADRPRLAAMENPVVVDMEGEFLDRRVADLPDFVRGDVEAWFDRHRRFSLD